MSLKDDVKRYRKTKKGVISSIYGAQKANNKRKGRELPTYTKKELSEWLYSKEEFHIYFDNWVRLDYQSLYKPSVDRIDDNLGYTMANIQLTIWKHNLRKKRNRIRKEK